MEQRGSRRMRLRQALGLLAGGALVAAAPALPAAAGRPRRRRGLVVGDGICAAQGQNCKSEGDCCSGMTCIWEQANPGWVHYCG
jgi:hypothetical protein